MSSLVPVAFYGLEVPSGDVLISGAMDYPGSYRITMAAIDPTAEPHLVEPTGGSLIPRATLKIVRQPLALGDDDSEEGSDGLQALLSDGELDDDDDEGSDDDEEVNGGPSDPSKSKKARRAKEIADLRKAMEDDDHEDVVDPDAQTPNGVNGISSEKGKGKAKATGEELDVADDEDDEDEEGLDLEEFVVCTLDPTKQYQQPLDITVGEDESVYFKVSGTHTVYLTGNHVLPAEDAVKDGADGYDSDEEDEYDLSPDENELDYEEESDELDDQPDPRIMELGTDDEGEEVPKLVKKVEHRKKVESIEKIKKAESPKPDNTQKEKKSKNKRVADDENDTPSNLDDIMAKSLKPAEGAANGEQPKLSKKQLKKLKNNAGQAVPPATQDNTAKKDEKPINGTNSGSTKSDKKVQFAKDLESPGKGGEKSGNKPNTKRENEKTDTPKATLGPKTVQGVIIDDKKLGTGPPAKAGDTVTMRYIGKLQSNNLQFDANKNGDPFKFKLGAGQVIKGWDIGVTGMSVRGERRITIPPKLGYGNKAMGKIPPNSTLIFEVKLLSIS